MVTSSCDLAWPHYDQVTVNSMALMIKPREGHGLWLPFRVYGKYNMTLEDIADMQLFSWTDFLSGLREFKCSVVMWLKCRTYGQVFPRKCQMKHLHIAIKLLNMYILELFLIWLFCLVCLFTKVCFRSCKILIRWILIV